MGALSRGRSAHAITQIHNEAQHREHSLTDAQLDKLDAELGHPTRDPHGDPIPSRGGTMPKAEGEPLTSWQINRPARIVHLEDEPSIAFRSDRGGGTPTRTENPHFGNFTRKDIYYPMAK